MLKGTHPTLSLQALLLPGAALLALLLLRR